jgi:hypothetical protein
LTLANLSLLLAAAEPVGEKPKRHPAIARMILASGTGPPATVEAILAGVELMLERTAAIHGGLERDRATEETARAQTIAGTN